MEENNTCVCCGEIIPEGRMVCVNCEKKIETFNECKHTYSLPLKLKWYQRLWLKLIDIWASILITIHNN